MNTYTWSGIRILFRKRKSQLGRLEKLLSLHGKNCRTKSMREREMVCSYEIKMRDLICSKNNWPLTRYM